MNELDRIDLRILAELLSDAETPPFAIESWSGEAGEDARLRHRYLDLRREPMREAIMLRSKLVTAMRRLSIGPAATKV